MIWKINTKVRWVHRAHNPNATVVDSTSETVCWLYNGRSDSHQISNFDAWVVGRIIISTVLRNHLWSHSMVISVRI